MIVVATRVDDVPDVVARLGELGVTTTRVEAPSDTRWLVLADVGDDRDAEVAAATLRAAGMLAVTRPESGVRLDGWLAHTEPMKFGDRLSVCFAWSEHDRSDLPGLIELGPGGFGSGRHAATYLVIEQMMERIAGGERVLDVGCGSGVLGLCALQLGASRVVAVDVKDAAIEATRRNAELNGMARRMEATLESLSEISGEFDVVVANIGRSAIVELAPDLVRLLSPGGWLAVSGISPPQCSQAADFLRPLVEVERVTAGDFSAVVLSRAV